MGKGSGRGGNASTAVAAGAKGGKGKAAAALEKKPPVRLVINGRQYDMTGYDHPGRASILDQIGIDATTQFYATHPQHVWKMIRTPEFEAKYLVKESDALVEQRRTAAGGYDFECEFYTECKQMVANHLARRKMTYGKHFDSAIVFCWTLFWCCVPPLGYANMLNQSGSPISCILAGMSFAMGTFNLMHCSVRRPPPPPPTPPIPSPPRPRPLRKLCTVSRAATPTARCAAAC